MARVTLSLTLPLTLTPTPNPTPTFTLTLTVTLTRAAETGLSLAAKTSVSGAYTALTLLTTQACWS